MDQKQIIVDQLKPDQANWNQTRPSYTKLVN